MKDVVFEAIHCRLTISTPAPGLCLAKFVGSDIGEFGDKPLDLLTGYLAESGTLRLFVDAREVPGASVDVSNAWAQWMQRNKEKIPELHFLSGSKFIQFTANLVRRFSGFEDRMRIYTDAESFTMELGRAINAGTTLSGR